ncbi:MAG: N-acetylgalactosamine-6-sulfatase [Rickettsiales bacterium]|nr:N-acetylgalactosamine-6-sulfatase [Rickettsiales bacterium]
MIRKKRYFEYLIILIIVVSGCTSKPEKKDETTVQKPNIVFILADDLGYGELGAYGQEKIETPNIDALAKNGMMFTQAYSGSPVCAPSRCVLLTGEHTGHTFLRSNDEMDDRGDVWSFEDMFNNPSLEGQIPLPASVTTVAEKLKEVGYNTGMIGKWGLGGPNSVGHPNNQGFDYFYGYLCQRMAHTYYPTHLWENGDRMMLDNELIDPHEAQLPKDLDSLNPESYARYQNQPDYAPEKMLEKTLTFLDNQNSDPFFLYLPFTLPHVSLQAPQKWVDYYHEKFGEEDPYTSGDFIGSYVPVRYPQATYAGMISYLDEQVGEVVKKLKEKGLYENTLIIFTSDNGPSDASRVDPTFFNSAGVFNETQGWGKAYVHEGGIRVPFIASWEGKIPKGTTNDDLIAFWDMMPTLVDVSGATPDPEQDGISILPALLGQEQTQHDFLYWEFPSHGGQQAVRMGKWKGIRWGLADGSLEMELFDLENDPKEEKNVADQFPEIVEQISNIMKQEHSVPEVENFKLEVLGDNS